MNSISYLAAQKISPNVKDEFWEKEDDFNWVERCIMLGSSSDGDSLGDKIIDLNKVLKEWKTTPPSKEILDDLKFTINNNSCKILGSNLRYLEQYLSDTYYFGDCKHWCSATDDQIFELINLLLHFCMEVKVEEMKKFESNVSKKIISLSRFINLFDNNKKRKN